MSETSTATVESPAIARLPQVNWELLGPLLRCPSCAAHALELRMGTVACRSCDRSYAVEDGIIDFVGQGNDESIVFYANPYYRRFIDNLAKIHAAHYESGGFGDKLERQIKKDLFRLVQPSDGPTTDLGCGLGECFPLMGPEERIIGVDYEMALLRQTHRRYPKATLMRADFAQLPFRTASLKRVFSIAVLEHVFYIESAMRHMQRCLAPDGRFYVAVPTEGTLAVDAARLVTSSRNAKVLGMTAAQSRLAQRKDHCNTVFLIENVLRKFFEIEATSLWPFRLGGAQINLSKAYRLKVIVPQ